MSIKSLWQRYFIDMNLTENNPTYSRVVIDSLCACNGLDIEILLKTMVETIKSNTEEIEILLLQSGDTEQVRDLYAETKMLRQSLYSLTRSGDKILEELK